MCLSHLLLTAAGNANLPIAEGDAIRENGVPGEG